MPVRQLTKRMLKRRVKRWGWYLEGVIIVVFRDGKMALVDVEDETYSSIRAWNPWIRANYARIADTKADGATLAEVLQLAKARVV